MKTKLGLMIAFLGLLNSSFGQLTFSVAPGLSMNSANLGYKFNRIVPFIGCQYFGGNFTYQRTYEDFNYDTYQIETYSSSSSAKVNLFLPNIGVKYFFKESDKLKAFVMVNIAKPLLFGKVTYDNEVETEVNDFFEGLSLWGGELSVGTEYYFDEHFSIGGEFGLRMLHASTRVEYDRTIYNPITDEYVQGKSLYTSKATGKPTFSKVSLNFYF